MASNQASAIRTLIAARRGNALVHHGATGELFGIHVVNLLLTIITLGVYRFWARTRIRDYLWSNTSYAGDRLEYTGTGKELFLGFLIAFVLLVALSAATQGGYLLIDAPGSIQEFALNAGLAVVFVFLVGVALYRARGYRLSRTQWRGIRGAQTGSAVTYGLKRLAYIALTIITLGFYWPFMNTRLVAYGMNNTWFGDRRFVFEGSGRALVKPFAIVWLLLIPTLGLSWFWYRAAALRYFAGCTRYEGLRFHADVALRPLALLLLANALLRVLTLGLASPYVWVRTARFFCENLRVEGTIDFARIAQSRERVPARGEGLAAALDVGGF